MDLFNAQNKRKTRLTLLIICLATALPSFVNAQYHLAVEAQYVLGFNSKEINLHHQSASENLGHGYQFMITNSYHLPQSKFEPTFKIGTKYLYTSGQMDDLSYTTETYKFAMGLGTRYHIDSTFTVGAIFGLENNLDFDYFRTQTSDLFRYTAQGEIQYKIRPKWNAMLIYEYAFYPTSGHYLFTNPQHQIKVGFTYQIL